MTSRRRGRHARRPPVPFAAVAVALALAVVGTIAWRVLSERETGGGPVATGTPSPRPSHDPTDEPSPSPEVSPTPSPTPGPINTAFEGITTFRGNATRTYYGEGPVPRKPEVVWSHPESGGLCSQSSDQHGVRTWCGTGWTGQPNVIVGEDGAVEVRFGAYDTRYHFLDGVTGEVLRAALDTGDLAKGSATSDPDGYPLYYAGSRDNLFRVIATDRPEPTVLWSVNASGTVPRPLWNNDWDGAALVIGDYLIEGGENSWVYVVRLNRGYDDRGRVTVDPRIVATIPGFDDRLLADLHDTDVSIESSAAFHEGVVYFANSGGLVQGWDVSRLLEGGKGYRRVFRFWTGDDTDASVVVDDEGYLYVGSQYQRFNARGREVGQLMKLDPSRPKDPLVWSIAAPEIGFEGAGGTWSTPALYRDHVYWATAAGRVLGIERDTGRIVWETHVAPPTVGSPVVVDDVLILGDCAGVLRAWDVSRPGDVKEMWDLRLPGCIESTPAIWRGWIYVGTRAGQFHGIADPATARAAGV